MELRLFYFHVTNYFSDLINLAPNALLIRSTHPEVFRIKDVVEKFAKCTGKHLCQNLSQVVE